MFSRKSSFAASTSTLTSVTSTSSTTSTATVKEQPRAKKDYFAALGSLQSSYGFGGTAPVLPKLPKQTKSAKSKQAKKAAVEPSVSTPAKGQAKDYEAAYGALASQYGFGGAPVAAGMTSKK